MKSFKRFKLIFATVVVVLLIVVILENTEAVRTEILFRAVTLPRALLPALTAAVGFVLGLFVAARSRKAEAKR